jgi:hypothetical protein
MIYCSLFENDFNPKCLINGKDNCENCGLNKLNNDAVFKAFKKAHELYEACTSDKDKLEDKLNKDKYNARY